jgi:iron-sulfur cluster assembly accessory protein
MSFIAIKSKKDKLKAEAPVAFNLDIPATEIRISDEAAQRIRELRSKESENPAFLRVGIVGGGCAGLSYHYAFEKEVRPTDVVFQNGDVSICVDPKSLKLIGGSLLHWQDSMKRMGFQIINKQGRKGCSCGESFSV